MFNHFGIKVDAAKADVLVSNPRKLPLIKKVRNDTFGGYMIIVYYQGPDGYGQQQFRFDLNEFLYAYNNSKAKRSTPKDSYTPFDFLFFDECYPKAASNKFVRFIFDCFIINPSVINKASNKKVRLLPKKSAVLSKLNIIVPRGVKGGAGSASSVGDVGVVDVEECNFNMNLAIKKAASSSSYMFFEQFLSAFCELNGLDSNKLGVRKKNAIFKKFVDSVDLFIRQHL